MTSFSKKKKKREESQTSNGREDHEKWNPWCISEKNYKQKNKWEHRLNSQVKNVIHSYVCT